jgi:hypothetical protein
MTRLNVFEIPTRLPTSRQAPVSDMLRTVQSSTQIAVALYINSDAEKFSAESGVEVMVSPEKRVWPTPKST